MKKLLSNPTVRLAGRALVAAVLTAVVDYQSAGGATVAWQSVAVGSGLAFCEIFTPLNPLVGVFKKLSA